MIVHKYILIDKISQKDLKRYTLSCYTLSCVTESVSTKGKYFV